MHSYLFITYGARGWRGVQVRAIRIANYLPSDEVLFWNCYDSDFIKENGFEVETKNPGIVSSRAILFPKDTEMVIFADLPTNEFFNFSVFMAAIAQKKKIVICEQLYRRKQMEETVYKQALLNSDLFMLNAISCFKSEESEKIKIVPPQIEIAFDRNTRQEMFAKYNIPLESQLIFGVGYHPGIFEKLKAIGKKLEGVKQPWKMLVVGGKDQKEVAREGNVIMTPYNIGDDFVKLLFSADVTLTKFGFLQILESLALHKPTIVLGEGGFILQNPDKLDSIYKEVLFFDTDIDSTVEYIKKLLDDSELIGRLKDKLAKLHDGELFGAKKAAELIKELNKKPTTVKTANPKKLAILVNNEVFEKETFLRENKSIYPLCIITGMSTENNSNKRIPDEILLKKLKELNLSRGIEILPHSFKELFLFSERRLDGFMDIMPWYDNWVNHLEQLLSFAETIYLTEQGKEVLGQLLNQHEAKIKSY